MARAELLGGAFARYGAGLLEPAQADVAETRLRKFAREHVGRGEAREVDRRQVGQVGP